MSIETSQSQELFNSRQISNVDDYYSSSMAGNNPHRYPGERPEGSFLTDGESVMPISLESSSEGLAFLLMTHDGVVDLDDYLTAQGVPPTGERIPVVSYGSNMCPPTIRKKTTFDGRSDLGIVPVVYGWMKGVDAVWHERPGQTGAFFAELYAGPETTETELQVGVSLFTREQLLFIHKSEQTYELGQYSTVNVDGGLELPAFIYAGSEHLLLKDGKLAAVAGLVRKNPNIEELESQAALDYILNFENVWEVVSSAIGVNPEELSSDMYTQFVQSLTLKDKKVFNTNMTSAVRADGLSSSFSMSSIIEEDFSWSNPSTIRTLGDILTGQDEEKLIRLPEQEVILGEDSESAHRQRNLVLRGIRKHWHNRN